MTNNEFANINTIYRNYANKYGTTAYNDLVMALTQDAYPDGTNEHPYYSACAIDENGNLYEITWEILEGMENCEDQGSACDWEHADSARKIGDYQDINC